MSTYTDNYRLRYEVPSFQRQIEVAVMNAADAIKNEDVGVQYHDVRIKWANWAASSSSVAWLPFAWRCAMNPAIQQSFAADPSGNAIKDDDIQFVVNSNLNPVILDWDENTSPGA